MPGLRASGPYSSNVLRRLVREVGQLRHRGLHPVRHLVLRDARCDLRIAELVQLHLIQARHIVDEPPARLRAEAGRIGQVEHRIAERTELHALVAA